MRIGLFSPHYAFNYGAVLQAFALKEYLRGQGYDAVILNRRPAYQRAIPSRLGRMARWLEEVAKRSSFGVFEEKFLQPQTEEVVKETDWRKFSSFGLDAVIVGSDQVWRDDYVFNSFGYNLFLDFVDDGTKKIAYAPSLGKESWDATDDVEQKVRELLARFDAISVREGSSIDVLKRKFGVEAELVVDPTMLLTEADYRRVFDIVETKKKKPYIAAYILDDNEMFDKRLKSLSKVTGMELHKVGVRAPKSAAAEMLNRFSSMMSVTKWVENIANANMVVTNSFHGMVFSIIFRKQFVVIMNSGRGAARFKSLLGMFGLEGRLVEESEPNYHTIFSTEIDYNSIESLIEFWRKKSFEYLHNSLSK